MEVLTKHELRLRKREIIEKVREGAIFIHPTDTIYGLGCSALNSAAVQEIRKLKDRPDTPFSVWIPSKDWIKENCENSPAHEKWMNELPGPYTLISKLKNKKSLASNIPNTKDDTVGIRMPEHWMHELVQDLGIPIVTTSANKTGHEFMTSLENLNSEIKRGVNFIIYEGEKKARPSRLVNLADEKVTER